jgi:ParB/RepB/Spo0J family partition protein
MKNEQIAIVYKRVDELREYENNPRNNDNAVAAVAASIELAGFKVPIVVDGDGVIVAGHTRLKAAKKLGMQAVPCIVADDLTDEQIRAFRLADNKTSELASWEFEKLEEELAALAEMEIDMTAFGFDDFEMDEPQEIVEDDYEAKMPENPYVKPRRCMAAWQTQTNVR